MMYFSYCANTILTIIIIVDSHITRCCVHDLIRVCREGFLVAQRQQVALFLKLSNQLHGQINETGLNLSRETLHLHKNIWKYCRFHFISVQGFHLFSHWFVAWQHHNYGLFHKKARSITMIQSKQQFIFIVSLFDTGQLDTSVKISVHCSALILTSSATRPSRASKWHCDKSLETWEKACKSQQQQINTV